MVAIITCNIGCHSDKVCLKSDIIANNSVSYAESENQQLQKMDWIRQAPRSENELHCTFRILASPCFLSMLLHPTS